MKRLLLALLMVATPLSAHNFHASIAEVERNAGTKKVEIAIRVFPDDLQAVLSQRSGKSVALENDSSDPLIFEYLRSTLAVKVGGKAAKLRWVGKEFDVKTLWLYVEVDDAKGALVMRNVLLMESFADQVNTINAKRGGAVKSTTFMKGDEGEKEIVFP